MSTYLLASTLEESLVEGELPEINILKHVLNFVVQQIEGFRNVDAELFLQKDEHDHPVCLATRLKIVLVKRSYSEELKDLILVNVLAHVADDMRFQLFQLYMINENVSKVGIVVDLP